MSTRRMRLAAMALLTLLAACEWIGGPPAPELVDPAAADAGPSLPVKLRYVPRGNGSGHVTLTPEGGEPVDCPSPGPACELEVAPDTTVHLVAAAALGSVLGLWTGVDGCSGASCDVTPRASVDVSMTVRLPAALAFVSSTVRAPGALGGRAAADAECSALALAAGYDGNFVALLGDASVTGQRLPPHGWVRSDGATVIAERTSAANGAMFVPIDRDELGAQVELDARVVTELTMDLRLRDGDHCSGYQLEGGTVGYGRASGTAGSWIFAGAMGCDEPAHLYCVQTDAAIDPHPPVAPGPGQLRAYYYFFDQQNNTSGFVPHVGRATADATCQDYAARTLGSTNPWIALLATKDDTATMRLPDGQMWTRVDGVPYGTSAELKSGHPRVPLNVTPNGSPGNLGFFYSGAEEIFGRVWIGAPSLAELGDNLHTCSGWSTAAAAARTAAISDGSIQFTRDENCNTPHGLWCVELPAP